MVPLNVSHIYHILGAELKPYLVPYCPPHCAQLASKCMLCFYLNILYVQGRSHFCMSILAMKTTLDQHKQKQTTKSSEDLCNKQKTFSSSNIVKNCGFPNDSGNTTKSILSPNRTGTRQPTKKTIIIKPTYNAVRIRHLSFIQIYKF